MTDHIPINLHLHASTVTCTCIIMILYYSVDIRMHMAGCITPQLYTKQQPVKAAGHTTGQQLHNRTAGYATGQPVTQRDSQLCNRGHLVCDALKRTAGYITGQPVTQPASGYVTGNVGHP